MVFDSVGVKNRVKKQIKKLGPLENILKLEFKNAKVETGENTLPVTEDNLTLPCGIYGKVTKN